jgi:hypothetical protein
MQTSRRLGLWGNRPQTRGEWSRKAGIVSGEGNMGSRGVRNVERCCFWRRRVECGIALRLVPWLEPTSDLSRLCTHILRVHIFRLDSVSSPTHARPSSNLIVIISLSPTATLYLGIWPLRTQPRVLAHCQDSRELGPRHRTVSTVFCGVREPGVVDCGLAQQIG